MKRKATTPKILAETKTCPCMNQGSIKSQDKDVDAILDEQGYFNVINNEGDPQFVERMAVFKFKFCPLCRRKL